MFTRAIFLFFKQYNPLRLRKSRARGQLKTLIDPVLYVSL